MALCFDLQMLMLKARFGWSDACFNELLRILGSVFPKAKKYLPIPIGQRS
jgi:hypothetical protein